MDSDQDRHHRIKKKDRTGVFISVAVHVVVIGIVLFLISRTELGQRIIRGTLQATRDEKKAPPPKQAPTKTATKAPPKTMQDAQPKASSRRSAATDAPAAVGEGLVVDTREKRTGTSSGGDSGKTNVAARPAGPPLKPPPPPRLFASAPLKSDIKQLLAERAKEAASTESFGSEQISKSGVSDAGAIIKNVAGATVVDGKFAVIRGLSDRYVTTTLNGGEIPSADPYRRSASLDLFPAQIIDKVVVAKTFTPDQQGSYTGGGINIVTKSFPERPFASISLGTSYNSQSNLRDDYLSYDGGGTDWLGLDDGGRALPTQVGVPNLVVPFPPPGTGRNPPGSPAYLERVEAARVLDTLTKAMGPTQFGGKTTSSPLNHNLSFALGDTTRMLGRPLGLFASMSHKRDFSFYTDGVQRRESAGSQQSFFAEERSSTTVNWSSMVTLAYQPLPDQELGFTFLFNQNGDDQTRQQVGERTDAGSENLIFRNRLYWTERNLTTYQLKGNHRFEALGGLKVDWLAALSQTSQDEPDARFFNFISTGGNFFFSDSRVGTPTDPTRYFRALQEENKNLKLDVTLPFRHWMDLEGELKMGLFYSKAERLYEEREIYYKGSPTFNGNPNSFLTSGNLGFTAVTNSQGRIEWTWNRYINIRDGFYTGDSTIQAAYGMLDVALLPKLRAIGGLRREGTKIIVDSQSDLSGDGHANLNEPRILPAVGLVYSLRTNMALRLAYGQTVSRPSFRELAKVRSYDPVIDEVLEGNPELEVTDVENYDVRWEWFPRPGELISASLFLKNLKKPVERSIALDGEFVTFINRDKATLWGVELEARKGLDFVSRHLRQFTLGGNVSYIQSKTELFDYELFNKRQYVDPNDSATRPLYDQSPYIINVDLNYENAATGTSASLLLNLAAPRIAISTLASKDVYEHPPETLDFVFAQKIGRHASLKFTARNLLDPVYRRTYGEKSTDRLYSSYRRGRTFGISFSYDF